MNLCLIARRVRRRCCSRAAGDDDGVGKKDVLVALFVVTLMGHLEGNRADHNAAVLSDTSAIISG